MCRTSPRGHIHPRTCRRERTAKRIFWPVQFWLARNDVNVNAQRRGTRKLLPLSKHGARSVARPHRASASIHISYVGLAVFLCLFSAFVFLFVVCLVGGGWQQRSPAANNGYFIFFRWWQMYVSRRMRFTWFPVFVQTPHTAVCACS